MTNRLVGDKLMISMHEMTASSATPGRRLKSFAVPDIGRCKAGLLEFFVFTVVLIVLHQAAY